MIQLIRAYKDGRVVAAEAYDHTEMFKYPEGRQDCRCIPTPLWHSRMAHLSTSGDYDKVTVTSIYLNRNRTT